MWHSAINVIILYNYSSLIPELSSWFSHVPVVFCLASFSGFRDRSRSRRCRVRSLRPLDRERDLSMESTVGSLRIVGDRKALHQLHLQV